MPDDTLRLRTELHGAAELSHLWKSFQEGNATIAEMVRLKKLLNESFQKQIPGTENVKEIGAQMLQVNAAIKGVTDQTRPMTAFGNTMRQLQTNTRELRYEMRATHFIIAQLTHAVSGTADSIAILSGISDKSKEATKAWTGAFEQAAMSGTGFYAVLRLMGPTMAGIAGPVGIAVAALGLLAAIVGKNRMEIDRLAGESLENLKKRLAGMTFEDFDTAIRKAEQQLKTLNEEWSKITPPSGVPGGGVIDVGAKVVSSLGALFPPERQKQIQADIKAQEDWVEVLKKSKEAAQLDAQTVFTNAKNRYDLRLITFEGFEREVKYAIALAKTDLQSKLAAEATKTLADERAKLSKTDEKTTQDRLKHTEELKKAEVNLQTAAVESMAEGTTKKIALVQLEYQKRVATYTQMRKDLPELARQIHEAELTEYKSFVLKMGSLLRQQRAEEEQVAFEKTPEGQAQLERQRKGFFQEPGIPGGRLGRLHGTPEAPLTEMMRQKEAEQFQAFIQKPQMQVLLSGLDAVGQSIEQNIIAKFGEAKSVFQIFEQAVIAGLIRMFTQMMVMKVASALFGLATGGTSTVATAVTTAGSAWQAMQHGGNLFEPVVGIGMRTGSKYLMGERPEKISPLFGTSAETSLQRIMVEGNFKLDGADFRAGFKVNRLNARKKALGRAGW